MGTDGLEGEGTHPGIEDATPQMVQGTEGKVKAQKEERGLGEWEGGGLGGPSLGELLKFQIAMV